MVFLISLRTAEQVYVHLPLNDNALTTSLIDVLSNNTGSLLTAIIKTGLGKIQGWSLLKYLHLKQKIRMDTTTKPKQRSLIESLLG